MPNQRQFHNHPLKCVCSERFIRRASVVSLAGQHTFVDNTTITRLLYVSISNFNYNFISCMASENIFGQVDLRVHLPDMVSGFES